MSKGLQESDTIDSLIELIAETGLPPIKCSWCGGGGKAPSDEPCRGCYGRGIQARCTCCKADEVRILNTTICRECYIDCRGAECKSCNETLAPEHLLIVAGAW